MYSLLSWAVSSVDDSKSIAVGRNGVDGGRWTIVAFVLLLGL